jgi:ribosomal small subunit protein bTHX
MGRGDKRSFKGKVFKGSHGKTRPRHRAKAATPAAQGAQGAQSRKK